MQAKQEITKYVKNKKNIRLFALELNSNISISKLSEAAAAVFGACDPAVRPSLEQDASLDLPRSHTKQSNPNQR